MKKYLLTMAVMAIFAIGFAASDEDSSSSNSEPDKKEQKYRHDKGQCIDMARCVGIEAAKEGANDLIRQGHDKSDLKGMAGQQARLKYKTINDCCRTEWFEKEFPEYFTASEQEKFRQQCIEAYVIGYMSALGKEFNQ